MRRVTQYDILMAHTEALAMNQEIDKQRVKAMRAVFGFVPSKRWTAAQKARAQGKA